MNIKRMLSPIAVLALAISFFPISAAVAVPGIDDILSANYEDSQWSLKAVNAQDAWATSTGDGVVVGLIDSGVDSSHPDLQGQLLDGATLHFGYDDEGNPAVTTTETDAADFTDEVGHGTHTAGIIAALHNEFGVTGLAYDSKVMPVRLQNLEDVWSLRDFAVYLDVAIRYATDNGADIISMSLGGPAFEDAPWDPSNEGNDQAKADEKIICDAVDYAYDAGVFVVAAAGNDKDWGNPASIPGHCTNTFEVGSIGPNSLQPSYFSTTDNRLAVMAPGETVLSTYPTYMYDGQAFQQFPYVEMSGTSMATPMVAAAAALYLDVHPDATPAEISTAIQESATDMGPVPGWDPMTGAGLLNTDVLVNGGSVSTELSPTGYLRAIALRESMNYSNGATLVWDTPYGTSLPESYALEVWVAGDDTAYYSVELDGSAVRSTVPVPDVNDNTYLVLTAHYDGGASLQAIPILFTVKQVGGSSEIDAPTGLQISRNGSDLNLSWDSYSDTDADQMQILVSGPGVWMEITMPRVDGQMPTSMSTTMTGMDAANSDVYVSVWAADDTGWARSTPVEGSSMAKAPMTLWGYSNYGDRVFMFMGSYNQVSCVPTETDVNKCAGKRVTYRVQFGQSNSSTTRWTTHSTVNAYFDGSGGATLDGVQLKSLSRGGLYPYMRLTPCDEKGKPVRGAFPVVVAVNSFG